MHMTDFAPVLSATSSRDCIWIMFYPQLAPAPARPESGQYWARRDSGAGLPAPLPRLGRNTSKALAPRGFVRLRPWLAAPHSARRLFGEAVHHNAFASRPQVAGTWMMKRPAWSRRVAQT